MQNENYTKVLIYSQGMHFKNKTSVIAFGFLYFIILEFLALNWFYSFDLSAVFKRFEENPSPQTVKNRNIRLQFKKKMYVLAVLFQNKNFNWEKLIKLLINIKYVLKSVNGRNML